MSERTHEGAGKGALHFRLILPVLALGGLEAQLGKPLLQFLQPVLVGEPSRHERGGISEQVWPCALQPMQGLDLDLKGLGRYSLYNNGGLLNLTTPGVQGLMLRPLLTQLLGQQLRASRIGGRRADFFLDLPAHGQISLPIVHGIHVRLERG